MNKLKSDYDKVCVQYVNRFCVKQDLQFEYWVGEDIGGIAVISDMFFDFGDIRLDIDFNKRKGLITEWYDLNLEADQKVNYRSYTMGAKPIRKEIKCYNCKSINCKEEGTHFKCGDCGRIFNSWF